MLQHCANVSFILKERIDKQTVSKRVFIFISICVWIWMDRWHRFQWYGTKWNIKCIVKYRHRCSMLDFIVYLNEHLSNSDHATQYHKLLNNIPYSLFTTFKIAFFNRFRFHLIGDFSWSFSSLYFSVCCRIGLQLFCGALDHTNDVVTLKLCSRSTFVYFPFLFNSFFELIFIQWLIRWCYDGNWNTYNINEGYDNSFHGHVKNNVQCTLQYTEYYSKRFRERFWFVWKFSMRSFVSA